MIRLPSDLPSIIGLAVAVGIAFWWVPDLILWLWS